MKKFSFYIFCIVMAWLQTSLNAQDSTQTELNQKMLSGAPGKTKMLLSGIAWIGFENNLSDDNATTVTNSFNSYGFSPLFVWKPSDNFFFESEIEIDNGEMELEYAKLSVKTGKYLTIGAGRMLTPFGAYAERWEPVHVERFASSPLRPDDEYLPDDTHLFWGAIMGIDARGQARMGDATFTYVVYLSNGPLLSKDENDNPTGVIQYENLLEENNNNKELGGRIALLPFADNSLEVGVSWKHGIAGDLGDDAFENVGATATAVDFNFTKSFSSMKSIVSLRGQFNSLTVDQADYFLSDSSTYTFDNKLSDYFVQFSFRPALIDNNFFKRVELLARYNSMTLPEEALWTPTDENGVSAAITRLDLGLDFWLSWRTGLRFAYETTSLPDGASENVLLIRLATGL